MGRKINNLSSDEWKKDKSMSAGKLKNAGIYIIIF
jgi:hypothetical protein